MVFVLQAFLVITFLYHILVTFVGYWVFGWANPQLPALLREVFWIIIIVFACWSNRHYIRSYLKLWKQPRLLLIVLTSFSVLISYIKWKWISDMFIGIKYWFFYLFILLISSIIWYFFSQGKFNKEIEDKQQKLYKFLKSFGWIMIGLVAFGFIWQWLKLILPNVFLSLGYWSLNDFRFGDKPPIYYLTWLGGTLRWQGIFAGPNNYWYFLIAFLPVILAIFGASLKWLKDQIKTKKFWINFSIILVWWLAILLTLSRTCFIGWAIVLAITNFNWIKKNWIRSSIIWFVFLGWLVGISLLKWTSTIAHITAKFGSLQYVLKEPMWYWLGTSGPAIHHNWTILPENYFIQLMIDIGAIWFLLWASVVYSFFLIQKKIMNISNYFEKSPELKYIFIWRKWLTIWWLALLIMWIFLHVFEDSMVNYSFFIIRGLLAWYLSSYLQKK